MDGTRFMAAFERAGFTRPAVCGGVPFTAVLSERDDLALGGYAQHGEHVLEYLKDAVALSRGDTVQLDNRNWRVKSVRLVSDGEFYQAELEPL